MKDDILSCLILSYRTLQFYVESDKLDYNKEVSNTISKNYLAFRIIVITIFTILCLCLLGEASPFSICELMPS
jgi:hypothetical protein